MKSSSEKETQKTPLEIAVERIIEASKTATKEEKVASLRRAGIVDKDGQLREPYIGIDRVMVKQT